MRILLETVKRALSENRKLPFSIYRSFSEQCILNVPVSKPLLILVLSGVKKLGGESEWHCLAGGFVFLSNTPTLAMRNIPGESEYFALLVEFEYSDFDELERGHSDANSCVQGRIDPLIECTFLQFIEWSSHASPDIWHVRRKEILHVLVSLGYEKVSNISMPPTLSHKIHTIIRDDLSRDLDVEVVSSMLGMSESTLRRKLNAEGDGFQQIKDRVKMGYGLDLVQTSSYSIGHIAELCGYASQSRFTDKFKQIFNTTPTELRKTKMRVSGE